MQKKTKTYTDKVLESIKRKPKANYELYKCVDAPQSAIQSALNRLREKGIIGRDDEGKWTFGLDDSGVIRKEYQSPSRLIVIETLKKHGPLKLAKIVFLSGLSHKECTNGLYLARKQGQAGLIDGVWHLGDKHDSVGHKMKQALGLIEQGKYTASEIGEIMNLTTKQVSQLVVRIKKEYELPVRKVLTLG